MTAEAREMLQAQLSAEPQSVEAHFLLGMIAIGDQDYRGAVARFRAALVHAPDATRIRLELARALFLARDDENAFRQFQLARAGNPPSRVVAVIERYLAEIRRRKSWSYNFALSVAPDTNINNGTSAREAELFGLPFQLGDETRRRSGVGLSGEGGFEIVPPLSGSTRIRAGASMQRREYKGSRFDDMIISVHTGPRIILDRWDLSLLGTGFRRWYGGRRLSEAVGARVEASWYPSSRTAAAFSLSAQRLRYPHSPWQSGPAFSLSAGVIRALTPA